MKAEGCKIEELRHDDNMRGEDETKRHSGLFDIRI